MILILNESKSVGKIKKILRGSLGSSDKAAMRKLLRHNIVIFKFIKRDGSLRRAKGTLHPSYLPPLRGGSPKPEHQFVYYDIEKSHWRSFRTFKFIKVIDVKPISKKLISKKAEELDAEDEEMIKSKKSHEIEPDVEKKETKKEKPVEKHHEEKPKHEEKVKHEETHKEHHHIEDEEPEEKHDEKHHSDKDDEKPEEKHHSDEDDEK